MGRGGKVKAGARTSIDEIYFKRLAALTRQQPHRVQRLSTHSLGQGEGKCRTGKALLARLAP